MPQVKPFMLRQAQHERLNLMAVGVQAPLASAGKDGTPVALPI